METQSISRQTLQRLPLYRNYLKFLPEDGIFHISATAIAEALGLNDVQVRKDLASISNGGRPKVGYIKEDLLRTIEQFLGFQDAHSAVIVGAGNLGRALLSYDGFSKYGLDVVVAFDTDEAVIGKQINGKQVLSADKIKNLCSRMKICIGIIAVPDQTAQSVCDQLIESGISAIWNFTPVLLKVPENVLVKNENLTNSLMVLSQHLTDLNTDNE